MEHDMSQDFRGFLQQMQGCAVSVVTWDHARLLGTLAAVTDDCIRMTGVVLQDSHDTGGWSDRLLIEDLLEDRGNQWPEIIIQRNLISTVTMVSDAARLVPVPQDTVLESPRDLQHHRSELSADTTPVIEHAEDAVFNVELQLGSTFAPVHQVVDGKSTMTDRVRLTRLCLERSLGFQLEPIAVVLTKEIPDDQFRVRIHGVEVGRGTIIAGKLLALVSENHSVPPEGIETVEPVYGLPAVWIDADQRQRAVEMGATVVDVMSVVATMLDHHIKRHARELLTYEAVSAAVEKLRESHPVTVANLIPHPVSLRSLFEVLRGLVAEGVVIQHLLPILESVGRHVEHSESMPQLLSRVRADISLIICGRHIDESGRLPVVVVDSVVAKELFSEVPDPHSSRGSLLLTLFLDEVRKLTRKSEVKSLPVLLVPHSCREKVWACCHSALEDLTVLSPSEIPFNVRPDVVRTIGADFMERLPEDHEDSPETLSEFWQRKPR
jgi:flagellar biosynthesis protein FlhA